MSIASEVVNYKTELTNKYNYLKDLGATLPTNKNLINLEQAINSALVYPHKALKALKNDGSVYVDSKWTPSNVKMRIAFKFQVNENTNGHRWFGSQTNRCFFVPWANGSGPCSILAHGTSGTYSLFNVPTAINTDYLCDMVSNGTSLTGTYCNKTGLSTTIAGDCLTGYTTFIFASHTSSIAKGKATFYFVRFYENDKLVRNYIPVQLTAAITAAQDSQGVARAVGTLGFMETVNRIFYASNTGSGLTAINY